MFGGREFLALDMILNIDIVFPRIPDLTWARVRWRAYASGTHRLFAEDCLRDPQRALARHRGHGPAPFRAFGTTPDLWLNLHQKVDLWNARQAQGSWTEIKPLRAAEAV